MEGKWKEKQIKKMKNSTGDIYFHNDFKDGANKFFFSVCYCRRTINR